MRLIDADKLLETLQDLEPHCDNKKYENWMLKMLRCYMPQIINDEPTAYDVDKVVEELSNADPQEMMSEEQRNVLNYAIEIVKEGIRKDISE